MGELKALEAQHPFIDSLFLEFCASRGIFTVEDFLIRDLNALLSLAEMQPNAVRLKQGFDQLVSVVDNLHRPWLDGVALLTDAQQNKQTLSLMYQENGSFLQEALRQGFVTELVGPSSSGKTQVCLQAAASVAKDYAGGVVFFDTGNSFSAKRIAQLVGQASSSTLAKDNGEALHRVMSNIWCSPVFDISSLLDALQQLELSLKNKLRMGQGSLRLLIVDSFSSVVIPVLGGNGPYGHALMTCAGNLLKKIAHEYNVSVLVTNHMVSGEGGSSKPALGETWKSIPHVQLLLSLDRETNACTISLLKHPSKAAESAVRFTIHNS